MTTSAELRAPGVPSGMMTPSNNERGGMLNLIATVVLVIWTCNFIATLLVDGYDGNAINGIFTVVIGTVIAIKGRQAGGKSTDGDEDVEK